MRTGNAAGRAMDEGRVNDIAITVINTWTMTRLIGCKRNEKKVILEE
jgi:hypothetical protein